MANIAAVRKMFEADGLKVLIDDGEVLIMARNPILHTMEEIEDEIKRLREDPHTRLYHNYMSAVNAKRRYMNQLRYENRKGRELAARGYTLENINDRLSDDEIALLNEMED